MAEALAYLAAATIGLWGISHAIPTRKVVAGFEPTTPDNHWLVLQEWVAEAVTMWGLAALVVMVTTIDADQQVTTAVYRVVAVILAALAVLTTATGARTQIIWFKVCPVLLTTSAAMLVIASFL
jgi:hypothetical protein